MASIIRAALQNFTLVLLIAGIVMAWITLRRGPRPWPRETVIDTVFSWFLLCPIGIGYFYNFIILIFFGAAAARVIGWADSPFQREVGFASLGFSLIGLLAFRGDFSLRLAAVAGPACFMLGAAAGHILDITRTGNPAPGNAGLMLYMDILLPLFGWIPLWLQFRYPPDRR